MFKKEDWDKIKDIFWMVKGQGSTSLHHSSLESAKTEAERIARNNGGKIYILKSIGYVERQEIPVAYTEIKKK